jgi:3-hydroxyacyl-[acyl-carrier-protein] dehydratase
MTLNAIKAAIPHREPFLLIDEIVEQTDNHIVCRKRFTGDEFWYRGHYPEYPLTPGVLLLESAMQAGAVLLSKVVADNPDKVPVVTRINNVKFKAMVRPGDTIVLDVTLTDQLAGAFDFACKMAPAP